MAEILIIDDSEEVITMLSNLIEALGHNPKGTQHSTEALELYKLNSFDVVLCDIFMPEKNGLDVLKEIMDYDPNAAVIVMTGMSTTERAVTTFRTGGRDYLEKPFKIMDLREAINTALKYRSEPHKIIYKESSPVQTKTAVALKLLEEENQSLYEELTKLKSRIKELENNTNE